MQLEFFPSRTLTGYLARLFATRILAVLIMLVLVLQTLDLLSEADKILAFEGNGQPELWHYVTLRAPGLVSFFMPYSVLLATLITLATLNQNSEVIAMKAAGLSAHQILAPLLVTAFAASVVTLGFNELVVSPRTAQLKAWEEADFGPVPETPDVRANVYLRDGPNILAAAFVKGTGEQTVMEGVTWYRRDAAGIVVEQVRSPRATWAGPGWQLERPQIFDVATTKSRSAETMVVAKELGPREVALSKVNAEWQNLSQLSQSIRLMKAAGRRTTELEGDWWHKIAAPFSAVLMPLLGAVAAFGLARSGALLIRSIIGMALGFAYFVVDNAALAMGDFGGYPPLIAAWAPFVLFALVGEEVLVRTEE